MLPLSCSVPSLLGSWALWTQLWVALTHILSSSGAVETETRDLLLRNSSDGLGSP